MLTELLHLHDLARSAHTFDLSDVFVVHPITAQRTLTERGWRLLGRDGAVAVYASVALR